MNKVERFIGAGCLALILIHLAASYFPHQRLWGLNLFYYMPSVWRWILILAGLLVLVPSVSRRINSFLSLLSQSVFGWLRKLSRYYRYILLSLSAAILFWLLRVKTYFLGDSFLRAKEINQGVTFSFTEPLDFLLHLKMAKLLGWDAFRVYAVLSVIAGAVFVFLVLILANKIAKGSKEKLLVDVIMIALGGNLLFFGYVESYTMAYVCLLAYVISSISYLQCKGSIIIPIVLFLVTASLHLSGVILLPSLIYLIFSGRTGKEGEKDKKNWLSKLLLSLGVVLLVGVGIYLLQTFDPWKKGLAYYLISPLGGSQSSYSFFSTAHLVDFINHQLLVSPVGILLLITSVIFFLGKINSKDKLVKSLSLVSICSLGYAFLIDPKLGYPRDWDLFAFSCLGYTILGIYLFLTCWRESKMEELRYVTLSLVFTSLVITLPWIYVNAAEERSVARIEHILDLDNERSAYGRENLAIYYSQKEEFEKEIIQWKKAIDISNNARYMVNLAMTYKNLGKYDLAFEELKRSVETDPMFYFTHFHLGEMYAQQGKHEEAISEYRKAIWLRPNIIQYYDNLGTLLSNLGRYKEALEVFQEGLNANPGYPNIYRNLGYTYYNLGGLDLAETYLSMYLQQLQEADDREEVLRVLRNIQQLRLENSNR
jgi:tetratricopeptide (TPR) repeat protein